MAQRAEKQLGFFVDTAKCTGCKTCQLSCKDENDLKVGVNWRRVYEYAGGSWLQHKDGTFDQNVFTYYTSISCNHCAKPACAGACPTGAMHKRANDGLVVVNQDVCIGCRYCEMACPYGAPQFDAEKKVMTKCDGCYDRVEAGKMPICIDSCPLRALDFGPIEELRARYGNEADIAPLPDSSLTSPSLVLKANRNAKPTGDRTGQIINTREV